MDSCQLKNSPNNVSYQSFSIPDNYDFSQNSIANIPYPDDSCLDDYPSPLGAEDVDLPPPPGAGDNDLPIPFQCKDKHSPCVSNPLKLDLPSDEDMETSEETPSNIIVPSDIENKMPLLPLSDDKNVEKLEEEFQSIGNNEKLFENRYSPSKAESDDENQDSATAKPKVLGKEQAKKRLLAFSLSKNSNTIKKQSKITPAKVSKEKPPNPNKSSGVQEQFRATISAIEAEKKKMLQNMPNYLLLEKSELAKSLNTVIKPSTKPSETQKNENDTNTKGSTNKEETSLNKSNDQNSRKTSTRKSFRSRSRSKSSRRQSRSKRRSRSRCRKRSRSRSKSRKSHSYKEKEEKNSKPEKKKSSVPVKKEYAEDWKKFKAAGLVSTLGCNVEDPGKEQSRRLPSPKYRSDFKPIFNYLKRSSKVMTPLQAKPALYGSTSSYYPEKTIKYTKAKPTIMWTENPAHATDFYMSKQLLLENCDKATAGILQFFIDRESRTKSEADDFLEVKSVDARTWYPRKEFLQPILYASKDIPESHVEPKPDVVQEHETLQREVKEELPLECNVNQNVENEQVGVSEEKEELSVSNRERHISLVNDSYLSDDEAKVEEVVVGDVKVQLDLGKKCVKVRSKWDSDYEGDNSEKEDNESNNLNKINVSEGEDNMELATPERESTKSTPASTSHKFLDDFNLKPRSKIIDPFSEKTAESSNSSVTHENSYVPGNLASEYEEFLKIVSFNANDSQELKSQEQFSEVFLPDEKPKHLKFGKPDNSQIEEKQKNQKFGTTDWDQESDHDEKSVVRKIPFNTSEAPDEFVALKGQKKKPSTKKKKNKKYIEKKKTGKWKKKQLPKKTVKGKKKKSKDSTSSESSTDSYDSDTESDSDDSSSYIKKKTKNYKSMKSSKKESSSESYSESDDKKSKHKKKKAKAGSKKKKKVSSESDEEIQNALLKQLDIKKQQIIKKIEEIDSISERSGKKKEKENRKSQKNEEILDKFPKLEKKKKAKDKEENKSKSSVKKTSLTEKSKKQSRKSESSSDTYSDSSLDDAKSKKSKKESKKKRESSESSSSVEKSSKDSKRLKFTDLKNIKPLENNEKRSKKAKKQKKKEYSTSDSESEDSSFKSKKKFKKDKNKSIDEKFTSEEVNRTKWEEQFNLEEGNQEIKMNKEQFEWENKKPLWKEPEPKKKEIGDDGDWEDSSSSGKSLKEPKTTESSWDEEPSIDIKKFDDVKQLIQSDEFNEKNNLGKNLNENNVIRTSELFAQTTTESLKTSLSNFSFNENSFCSYGQELSRDFFLTERSLSNTQLVDDVKNVESTLIEPRPFKSVNKDKEVKALLESELYSPGHSDSEVSDIESNEKSNKANHTLVASKKEVYDPLNCESDVSAEISDIELSCIPLPRSSNNIPTSEVKNVSNADGAASESLQDNHGTDLVGHKNKNEEPDLDSSLNLPPIASKAGFAPGDFNPVVFNKSVFGEEKTVPLKRQIISVKAQQKLKSKAASVFQDESDTESDKVIDKAKTTEPDRTEVTDNSKSKIIQNFEVIKDKGIEKSEKEVDKKRREVENKENDIRESNERKRRSLSCERKDSEKPLSSSKRKTAEKREIRSDSFEIEPLKMSDSNALEHSVQPIPVLTGLGTPFSDSTWNKSHGAGYVNDEFSELSQIDHAESFDIYPSDHSRFPLPSLDKELIDHKERSVDRSSNDKSSSKEGRNKRERHKSRSRSISPRKRRRSRSSERRKSPRRRSVSPKRREKSPYSPHKRSPKRKSPVRRYKSSRSPDRRRKSRSKSPRRRRSSLSRRSRSSSPRKHRSPKKRWISPKRRDSSPRSFSPKRSISPRVDSHFSYNYSDTVQSRIPVIGADKIDMEVSPSTVRSPQFDTPMTFASQLPDSAINEAEVNEPFYSREYTDEFGVITYPDQASASNLITLKSHDMEKGNSPERLSLDQRIELELGVQLTSASSSQNDRFQMQNHQFSDVNPSHFQNSFDCENSMTGNENFYPNQNTEFSEQYFNGQQQPPNYGSFPPYHSTTTGQSSMMQVGNIVEVVPAMQHPRPPPPVQPSNPPHIMQVGNILQVVPSLKGAPASMPSPSSLNYGQPSTTSPLVKTQKATAVVAPSSVVPTPNPEAVINPLIKAIQLEREKRKKEKEKRKAEREARRKARQLRREAKLLSVNEKLKKSVQDEGLMLGQEVEDEELLDTVDLPSPPVPVEIITVTSQSVLPSAGKGILITAGFMPKPPSEKKEVKFADGVCPGEGTSTSGDEEIVSPPPKPKLPKEKRFRKKKTKVKKKVKVQIIRQIIQDEDDDDDDDLSPPPPPPGDPPPIFFARFPFAGDAQFPVYQTQTTTTTLTTVQLPPQSFQ